jgi:protein-arginine kinase activator protein McsA
VWDYHERQSSPSEKKQGLASYSEEELEALLNDALDLEDYQKAAQIRDEINRRKSN